MVIRFDVGALRKPVKTPQGFLKVDAYLTRTGIFEYRRADGTVQREYRDPSVVFDADAMASFALAPVTNDHPPEMVGPANVKQFQCGNAGEPCRDGDKMRASMLITDAALIADMEAGRKTQVSNGYSCDLEMTPGEWNGEKYDAVQKNIRGNHVAIVAHGRAGADCVARMDGAAWTEIEPNRKDKRQMATIKFDGIDYEVSNEAAQAFAKLEGRADAAEAQVKKLDGAVKAAEASIDGRVRERVSLVKTAQDILGADAKVDAMSDKEIKLAVIAKAGDEVPKSRQDDLGYIDGRFDAACRFNGKGGQEKAREVINGALNAPPVVVLSKSDEAREKARKDAREQWTKPIVGAATK